MTEHRPFQVRVGALVVAEHDDEQSAIRSALDLAGRMRRERVSILHRRLDVAVEVGSAAEAERMPVPDAAAP